jgi:uncharacterized DUF497 family protein
MTAGQQPRGAKRGGTTVALAEPEFEWDGRKAATNQRKHGVSFEEAKSVFPDPLAVIHDDPDSSGVERREIIIGSSAGGRLLMVCFTERSGRIRIISARPATRHERRDYEESR